VAREKLSPEFAKLLSDKLMDLGNLAAIALVFGQFISGQPINIGTLTFGLIFIILCYIVSYRLNK